MDTMLSGKSFLIGAVAQEAGTLGIEIADVAGSVEDVSSRMAKKTEIFAGLRDARAWHDEQQQPYRHGGQGRPLGRPGALSEVEESRGRLKRSLTDIGALVEGVTGMESQLAGFGKR